MALPSSMNAGFTRRAPFFDSAVVELDAVHSAKRRGQNVAFIPAIAAGVTLAMLADTMIPEAFEEHYVLAGLIAAFGYLAAFIISQAGGRKCT